MLQESKNTSIDTKEKQFVSRPSWGGGGGGQYKWLQNVYVRPVILSKQRYFSTILVVIENISSRLIWSKKIKTPAYKCIRTVQFLTSLRICTGPCEY